MSNPPVYRWRLTDSGKRLWRLRTAFTLDEVNEAEFIDLLAADPMQAVDGALCLSCGTSIEWAHAGWYCRSCIRLSYEKRR